MLCMKNGQRYTNQFLGKNGPFVTGDLKNDIFSKLVDCMEIYTPEDHCNKNLGHLANFWVRSTQFNFENDYVKGSG